MWGRRLRYVLTLIALCSIATCPAAKRSCTANNRSREANDLLNVLADRVASVVATTGKVPPVAAGPTPQPSCCEQGGMCKADPTLWTAQGWRDLQFSVDGEHRYVYQYVPDASGQSAILRATGDLDCDEEASLYELKLTVKGTSVVRTWHRKNPYE
ncbi:MAG TPA: hypothetical protein VIV11_14720 [Kofleriaceae bacterium]